MSMISYQWSLKDTSVSGLGMDSKLKNVKCKKIYKAIRLTLLFFFLLVSQSFLGYFTRSQYWHQIVKENVLDDL